MVWWDNSRPSQLEGAMTPPHQQVSSKPKRDALAQPLATLLASRRSLSWKPLHVYMFYTLTPPF